MGARVTGIGETLAMLEGAESRVRSLRPFLEREAAKVEAMIARAWAERQSPGGEVWPPSSGDGGSLRTAHTIRVGERSLEITVDHDAARYQFFGTSRVPARNPLPVDRDGVPIRTGYAGEFWAQHEAGLAAYLAGEETT